MSKKDEAMKLALEALKFALHVGFDESSESQIKKGDKAVQQHQNAIAALREALAEQPAQQEPVAWMYPSDYEKCLTSEHVAEVTSIECTSLRTGEKTTIPLYTSPQPSKPWVDLTDEQIDDIYQGAGKNDLKRARAIEAKLKEKNT